MINLDAVTLKQLRALAAIADRGSITGAAEALRLTPPAIHAQIKGLESALEVQLLRRSTNGAGSELTDAGAAMLEAAARIQVTLRQCADQIDALTRGHVGRVTLGVVSTAKYFAPRLVKQLRGVCGDIEVVLRIGNRTEIVRDLERHALDLAIMGRPPRQPAVIAEPLGPHPHGLIAAPDHPLALKGETVCANDLLGQTFIAREVGSGTRILMSRYLDRVGEGRPYEMIEMGLNEAIKQAVIAGLGIAFISLHTVTDEVDSGRLVLLNAPDLPIMRHWFLVWPSAKPSRPTIDTVREAILSMNGNYLPRRASQTV